MPIVYQHRRNDNNDIFYIGIGVGEKRAYEKYGRNSHWVNVSSKYGYTVEVTHKDICFEEAKIIEKYLISFYGRYDLGFGNLVNKTDGGDGTLNTVTTEETKLRLSLSNKGKKRSKEHIAIIIKTHTGRKHRQESKEKMSLIKKERYKKRLSDGTLKIPLKKKYLNRGLVLNLENGIFYSSAKEASDVYGYKHNTLRSSLNGYRPNKTKLIRV